MWIFLCHTIVSLLMDPLRITQATMGQISKWIVVEIGFGILAMFVNTYLSLTYFEPSKM